MSSESETRTGKRDLSPHLLSTSMHMIGVCTTLIGLVKIAKTQIGPSHVDHYAGIAALVFLLSAGTAYLSIHYAHRARVSQKLEWIADLGFICGLGGISAIAVFFAYEVI